MTIESMLYFFIGVIAGTLGSSIGKYIFNVYNRRERKKRLQARLQKEIRTVGMELEKAGDIKIDDPVSHSSVLMKSYELPPVIFENSIELLDLLDDEVYEAVMGFYYQFYYVKNLILLELEGHDLRWFETEVGELRENKKRALEKLRLEKK